MIICNKKRRFSPAKVSAVGCVIAAFAPSFSYAQRAPSILEEVIVTAQKREENANDVGIAITAYTSEQMDALNMVSGSDVAAQAPAVETRRNFAGRGLVTNLFIRGVGSTDLNSGSEQPVAAFVDDFYIISTAGVDFALFDMNRVEIIKGPQGTLFGRNATGGAFQYFTQEPEDEFSGYVEAGAGTDGILQTEARLNLPVSEKLKLRFSGVYDSHDAFTENSFAENDDIHESNFKSFRAQAKYYATEEWTVLLKAETGKAYGNIPGDNLKPMQKDGDDVVFAAENGAGVVANSSPSSVSHDSLDYAENKADTYLLRNVWDGDAFTFTSISAYQDLSYFITEDCDASPVNICSFHPISDTTHFSQEFRLNGATDNFDWTAGAYYLKQDADGSTVLSILNGLADPNDPNVGIYQISQYDLDVESKAIFGQIDYHLSESITLIAGLRYSNDTKEFEEVTTQSFANIADLSFDSVSDFTTANITPTQLLASNEFTAASAGDLTKIDDDSVSGTLQLNWQPNDASLYYASFRRGIKAGGFNNGVVPLGTPLEDYPYAEEVLDAYELGAKLQLEEYAAQLNAAVFYYDYADYQSTRVDNVGQFFANQDAVLTGGEVEIFLNPVSGLDIVIGSSVLDTNVEDVPRGGVIADREMGEAPHFTANALIRYEWSLPVGYLSAQLDGRYVGARHSDAANYTANELPSYSLLNANTTYTSQDEKVFVRLWVKNLVDKRFPVQRIQVVDLLNTGQENFNDPRTAGVTVGYNF